MYAPLMFFMHACWHKFLIMGIAYVTGRTGKAPPKDYSQSDDGANRLFGALNGISIIATTYASGIIPENSGL